MLAGIAAPGASRAMFGSLFSAAAAVAGLAHLAAAQESATEVAGMPMMDPRGMSTLEGILTMAVILFVINFVQGFRVNMGLIPQLIAVMDPILETQFSKLGIDDAGTRFIKDGACDFVYYATGRRYATCLTAAFELQNRQDLFARVARLFQSSMKDRCVLSIPLAADYPMEPVSLLLVKSRELERLRNSGERTSACLRAVEEIAGEVGSFTSLPGKFHVLADHEGVVSAVLNKRIVSRLEPIASGLHSLQITDSGNGWDIYSEQVGPRFVRIVFDLPVTGVYDMRAVLEPMLGVAVDLVDMSANMKLAPAARTRAVELRKRAEEQRQKQRQKELREANEEKRLEKKRAAEKASDEKTAGSAAKQAKAAEKKRKLELKQRIKKASRK